MSEGITPLYLIDDAQLKQIGLHLASCVVYGESVGTSPETLHQVVIDLQNARARIAALERENARLREALRTIERADNDYCFDHIERHEFMLAVRCAYHAALAAGAP